MVGMARNWIVKQLTLGEFDSHGHVWRKAFVMAIKLAMIAYGINLFFHSLMYAFDLLPYSIKAGLIAATIITPTIAFMMAFLVYAVLGFAIHDLGVSRSELEHLSRTDVLSGLANRRAFLEAFEECDGEKVLMVIDIDRFKRINDRYGHSIGDEVIVKVGKMLTHVFGDKCLCARIGGEEYAVFSGDLAFAEFAALGEIARCRVAAMPIETDAGTFSVTISGGVARALPSQSFGEVFSRADGALYSAKAGGRDRIVLNHDTERLSPDSQPGAAVA